MGFEAYCHTDCPMAATSLSHTHQVLSTAEKKYAQLEQEALSLVFVLSKFHKYLYGGDFVLQTNHLPLIGLLKEDRAISAMASARIQRWVLTISNYQYHLEYRPDMSICRVYGLSRLPLPDTPGRVPVPEEEVLALTTVNDTPTTAEHISLDGQQPIRYCHKFYNSWNDDGLAMYHASVKATHTMERRAE